jgi:hypothetical protein
MKTIFTLLANVNQLHVDDVGACTRPSCSCRVNAPDPMCGPDNILLLGIE